MSRNSTVHCSLLHVSGGQRMQISRKGEEEMEKQTSSNPFWRQGDIYFVKVDEEPRSYGTPVKNGVIAKGETTGHSHRLAPMSMDQGAELSVIAGSMFLRSPEKGTKIVHDEHHAIDLPKGLYAVVHQQEFDGLRWRRVFD
jgi:hypothetical protein